MKISMTLTLDGMLRALRARVHTRAEEIESTAGFDGQDEPPVTVRRERDLVEDRPR
ncbi:MAG: hypothetical protein JJ913_14430 [Rhizobiaceae bacterium]|nr:hypothetical protein [Rhizobiaceae bacterium]